MRRLPDRQRPSGLSSASAIEQEQLETLKYLGHWVGDIHQPLHVSFQDDRGGNEIGVSGGLCSWDLHAVWDSCTIEEGLPGDPYSMARDLLDEVTDKDRATWRASGPMDWATESFAISISPEVGYCVRRDTGCWYDADNEHWVRASRRRWWRSIGPTSKPTPQPSRIAWSKEVFGRVDC